MNPDLLAKRVVIPTLHLCHCWVEFHTILYYHLPLFTSLNTTMENFDDDKIPSYEESLQQGATSTSAHSKQKSLPLLGTLSAVRTRRINAIIENYISPLLQSQLSSGLSKTTLVLVPSNVSTLQKQSSSAPTDDGGSRDIIEGSLDDSSQEDVVIGFPSSQYIKLVRLHGGEDYTLEFWRQAAVLAELDSSLKAWLEKGGFCVAKPNPKPILMASRGAGDDEATSPISQMGSSKTKRSFFSRAPRKSQDSQTLARPSNAIVPAVLTPTSSGSWSLVQEEALEADHMRVKVSLQDVCLRIVTEMGLYETSTGKAVVVDIEIGG